MTTIDRAQRKVLWFYIVAIVVAVGAMLVYYLQKRDTPPQYSVTAIKLPQGYGYQISIDGKVYIHQDHVPAIDGKHPFCDSLAALKTGELTLEKIVKGEVPTISKDELLQLGIDTGAFIR